MARATLGNPNSEKSLLEKLLSRNSSLLIWSIERRVKCLSFVTRIDQQTWWLVVSTATQSAPPLPPWLRQVWSTKRWIQLRSMPDRLVRPITRTKWADSRRKGSMLRVKDPQAEILIQTLSSPITRKALLKMWRSCQWKKTTSSRARSRSKWQATCLI